MQKFLNFVNVFKSYLFMIFLGNKDISKTILKKSFLKVALISISVILLCMALSYPLNLQLGWGFQEGRPVTWLSFFFLLLVGFISLEIFKFKKISDNQNKNIKMWKYLGIGFIYLAFDDLLIFHEEIDHTICKIFGFDKHGPADKIDDVIIVIYGIIMLSILIKYFSESIKFKKSYVFFGFAILMTIISTICDLSGGMTGPLSTHFNADSLPKVLKGLDIVEETAKSFAEVFFIGAFLNMYHYFKSSITNIK